MDAYPVMRPAVSTDPVNKDSEQLSEPGSIDNPLLGNQSTSY